jgi:cyclopropane-fatty-acyl-phospholipid synthase
MEWVLISFFERCIKKGKLRVTYASGQSRDYGDGTGNEVSVRYASRAAQTGFALDPAMKFGESYMDGGFVVEKGTIYDYIVILKQNAFRRHLPRYVLLPTVLRLIQARLRDLFGMDPEKRNIAHHYDLDGRLYELFLDDDWQYTCAYFEHEDQSLEDAQLAKKRHVTAKLMVEPGQRVLEMGCGWGGLAMYIAEMTGAHVTAVTLSEEQAASAQRRAASRGLAGKTEFRLQNYRDVEGTFDRIISIGMLEHVGPRNFAAMFKQSYRMLDKHGVMVVHAIGRPKVMRHPNPWMEKYIFPGGYIPAVSEVVPAIEQAGFLIKDIELLPVHYARTCRLWRERFVANWDKAAELYDERFCRMWEIYLALSESAFRHDRLMIFQIQLAKHQDTVPYTRDYLATLKNDLEKWEMHSLTKD